MVFLIKNYRETGMRRCRQIVPQNILNSLRSIEEHYSTEDKLTSSLVLMNGFSLSDEYKSSMVALLSSNKSNESKSRPSKHAVTGAR